MVVMLGQQLGKHKLMELRNSNCTCQHTEMYQPCNYRWCQYNTNHTHNRILNTKIERRKLRGQGCVWTLRSKINRLTQWRYMLLHTAPKIQITFLFKINII